MGAIYGFTGPADEKICELMGLALQHRGRFPVKKDRTKEATIIYHPQLEDNLHDEVGCGLYKQGPYTLAIAGYLSNIDDLKKIKPQHSILPLLISMYREQGLQFISKLQGAFVLVLRDHNTLYLARDGAGVRTIYYSWFDKRFLFAIEPKGILAVPGYPRRIRAAAIAQYFTFSFVPGKETMLENLCELPPGHTLTIKEVNKTQLKRYFYFESEESSDDTRSEQYWLEEFSRYFKKAVSQLLPQRESVGIFLSGGIDSSIVTAEVARQHQYPVRTYTIHFGKKYPNELDFARSVAERWQTEHREVLISPKDFLPRLRKIIWHLDDPIGDPITVPNFELAAHAAQDGRWLFNGEGGDPCFGGPKNFSMLIHHWYGGIKREANSREKWYLASYRRAYEEWPYLLTDDWLRQIDPQRDLEAILTPFFNACRPAHFLNKLMAINIRLKGAHLILPKVERMTAAWGLIPLAPLFAENLLRLSFAMPPQLKLARGVEKIVLKRAYADLLPHEVINRPKSGMRVPLHYWFQKEMKSYARKILSSQKLKQGGIFDPKRVKKLLRYDIEEGPGRYGLRLWMLITFEIWRRIVVERED